MNANGRPRVPFEQRFWAKVAKSDGCWEWQGSLARSGYGTIRYQGRNGGDEGAHRVSYKLHNGSIPAGMWVLHRCDNRRCVNPDHLYVGTASDNNRDTAMRNPNCGNHCRGELNHAARLTFKQVRRIKQRITSGEPARRVADDLCIPRGTVYSIKQGRTWAHV